MATLVELSNSKHANLKVISNSTMKVAEKQHIVNLRVVEVVKAVSSFPVFFNRMEKTGEWMLSAITSLEMDKNLFIKDGMWDAIYLPSIMQTYPMFLMQKPSDETQYTIGIDEKNAAFSETEGEPLFDDKGKASLYLSQVRVLLDEDIKNNLQTYHFSKKMEELNLMKAMDIQVHYADGKINTLKGLQTIHEENLQSLEVTKLEELREKGYLAPIYAILFSIYQLNSLIRKHNALSGSAKITQIKMEVAKGNV